jgi:hypothetical protein
MPSCEGIELLLVTVEVELAGDGGGDEGRAVFAEEGDGGLYFLPSGIDLRMA